MYKRQKIKLESIIVQATGFIAADLDGEKAMLSVEKGKYYGLNSIGSRIWDLIDRPVSVKEIIATLIEEYDVAENTCHGDVCIFLNKIYDEGLIAIV
jgi:hypothetical protein